MNEDMIMKKESPSMTDGITVLLAFMGSLILVFSFTGFIANFIGFESEAGFLNIDIEITILGIILFLISFGLMYIKEHSNKKEMIE